jgi:hypothetical protein
MVATASEPGVIVLHGVDGFGGKGGLQAMQLDMSNEVLEELLACTRRGKAPQIQFGRNPVSASVHITLLFCSCCSSLVLQSSRCVCVVFRGLQISTLLAAMLGNLQADCDEDASLRRKVPCAGCVASQVPPGVLTVIAAE